MCNCNTYILQSIPAVEPAEEPAVKRKCSGRIQQIQEMFFLYIIWQSLSRWLPIHHPPTNQPGTTYPSKLPLYLTCLGHIFFYFFWAVLGLSGKKHLHKSPLRPKKGGGSLNELIHHKSGRLLNETFPYREEKDSSVFTGMAGPTTAATAPSTVTKLAVETPSRTTSSTARGQTQQHLTAVSTTSQRTTSSTESHTLTTESRLWSSSGMDAAVREPTHSTSITTSTSLTTRRISSSTVLSPYLTMTPSSATTSTSAWTPRMSSRECFRLTTSPSLIFPLLEVTEMSGLTPSLQLHLPTTICWQRTLRPCK